MTDENLLQAEVPEKFRDGETGEVRLDALVRSYRELEKRLSQNPSAPKSPEDYCIECGHGMFEPDMDINRRLHEHGFTPEQAQLVYDLAAEKLMPMIMDVAGEMQADREVEKLINHFGGPEKWKEISRQMLAFGRKNLPGAVLDNLSSSYEGILALHRMMKSEEPGLKPRGADTGGGFDEKDLHAMMKDPRYWCDKDPSFVSQVTDGFRRMYGN